MGILQEVHLRHMDCSGEVVFYLFFFFLLRGLRSLFLIYEKFIDIPVFIPDNTATSE